MCTEKAGSAHQQQYPAKKKATVRYLFLGPKASQNSFHDPETWQTHANTSHPDLGTRRSLFSSDTQKGPRPEMAVVRTYDGFGLWIMAPGHPGGCFCPTHEQSFDYRRGQPSRVTSVPSWGSGCCGGRRPSPKHVLTARRHAASPRTEGAAVKHRPRQMAPQWIFLGVARSVSHMTQPPAGCAIWKRVGLFSPLKGVAFGRTAKALQSCP